MNRISVIIPARMDSSRFPGKPLVRILGKPMVQWVYERVAACKNLSEILVATCDTDIFEAVEAFGGHAVMTSDKHTSGTDRIAEAALSMDTDIVVNVQGDEPLMESVNVELAAQTLINDPGADMSSLMFAITSEEAEDPNLVKVVVNRSGRAMYFSRSPLPYQRKPLAGVPIFGHAGIYAYRKDFLFLFSQLSSTALEQSECLEQLRVLEHGYSIAMAQAQSRPIGVDTPEDLDRVQAILAADLR